MRVSFVSRRYELGDAQKSFVTTKLETIRQRYFDRRIDVQVELTSEKSRHRCELNVHSDGFQELVRTESHDMQQSIAEALEKLELMLRKRHDKMVNRKQRIEKRDVPHELVSMPDTEEVDEVEVTEAETADELQPEPYSLNEVPEIIETDKTFPRPLPVSEAAAILQASADQFMVFREPEANEVSVLYKRLDGKLGLIRH